MRRLPGKYIVLAMLVFFLILGVLVVVVALGALATLRGELR